MFKSTDPSQLYLYICQFPLSAPCIMLHQLQFPWSLAIITVNFYCKSSTDSYNHELSTTLKKVNDILVLTVNLTMSLIIVYLHSCIFFWLPVIIITSFSLRVRIGNVQRNECIVHTRVTSTFSFRVHPITYGFTWSIIVQMILLTTTRQNLSQGFYIDLQCWILWRVLLINYHNFVIVLFSLVINLDLQLHTFHVKNDFLYGDLSKNVCMKQPLAYAPNAKYGLVQILREWFYKFSQSISNWF